MKYIPVAVFISAISIAGPAVGAASLKPGDFRACADVAGAVKPNALYFVHLSGEILERCAAGCPDLRLFGPAGQETPFTVIENIAPAEPQEKYPLEITGYSDGPEPVITMRLPEKRRPVSVIEVHTADRDFKKRAVLSSSRDGRTWRTIAEDAIYDFSSRVDFRKTRIEFKKTDDRYFRLKLSDDGKVAAKDAKIRLRYEGLDFSVEGMAPKELTIREIYGLTAVYRESVPVHDSRTFTALSPRTDKDGNTVMLLKAGLPLDRISFDITNPYYSRAAALYAGDKDDDDSLRFVMRGTIYRFSLDGRRKEQIFIAARSPKRNYYRIVVENRGNPPLDVKAVTLSWVQQNLYFIALSAGDRHTLCIGNEEVTRPEYDIARFITRANLSQHAPVRLGTGAVRENPEYVPKKPKQTQERVEKIILVSVVIVLVAGMGYWAFTLIRKAGQKP